MVLRRDISLSNLLSRPRAVSADRHPPRKHTSFASSDTENLRRNPAMPPSRAMFERFSNLRARARKKVRSRHHTFSASVSEHAEPAGPVSPVGVQSIAHATATAEPDGLWESLHVAPGILSCPVSLGAATTAGVELTVDVDGSGAPLRTRKSNQDCYGVTIKFAGASDGVLAAVYDGHGMQGRECARLAMETIPRVMKQALTAHMERCGGTLREALSQEDRRRAYVRVFTKAFAEAEKELREGDHEIQHGYSGTTATCMWLDGTDLYVAWAGDSRAIMGRRNDEGDVEAVDLTWDQKPVRVDEKKRVRAAGGRVTRWKKNVGPQRVWLPDEWMPGLAMTRSIGDTILSRYGVFPVPEVTVTRLSMDESFVVAASDGVWEFMSSSEVADFVAAKRDNGCCAETVARDLVNEAVKRWAQNESVVDDTTAVILFLDKNPSVTRKGSLLMGRARVDGKEFENRSLRDVFRTRRVEIPREAPVGQPWAIGGNGKLEPFCPENHGGDVGEDEGRLEAKVGE